MAPSTPLPPAPAMVLIHPFLALKIETMATTCKLLDLVDASSGLIWVLLVRDGRVHHRLSSSMPPVRPPDDYSFPNGPGPLGQNGHGLGMHTPCSCLGLAFSPWAGTRHDTEKGLARCGPLISTVG